MKNKLILTLLLLPASLFLNSTHLSAQSINREIGLRMTSFDSFNFIYKQQKAENKFLRFRADAFNVNLNSDFLSAGLNLAMGIEKRKTIDDKLSFIHGFEPSLRAAYLDGNNNSQLNTGISFGYVLGFHLNLTEKFAVNLETIPSLSFNMNISERFDETGNLGLGFNSNAIALTAVYRFTK